jgi:hypothetical protein
MSDPSQDQPKTASQVAAQSKPEKSNKEKVRDRAYGHISPIDCYKPSSAANSVIRAGMNAHEARALTYEQALEAIVIALADSHDELFTLLLEKAALSTSPMMIPDISMIATASERSGCLECWEASVVSHTDNRQDRKNYEARALMDNVRLAASAKKEGKIGYAHESSADTLAREQGFPEGPYVTVVTRCNHGAQLYGNECLNCKREEGDKS